ncbi:hypothetical protein C1882_18315 [Pseudomonas sp. FW305-E2]|uniref:hypothetical protein n=1 Tax=Pseudomonas sp. FW305-E2 TaxID=2075558 RepID=UPI000B4F7EAB|nr:MULTISPECIES: hypothetical protein [Pseudomonas]POA83702.1 hypothetical protein C1882_18315 [Pseudomonas sp. FW305-E2]
MSGEMWCFQNAVFAHWNGGITVFGFAYQISAGIESGTGHHTKVHEAWLEATHLYFQGTDGHTYQVLSRVQADFSDATDAYDDVLRMAGGDA